jgi:hypothetical protein
MVRGRFAASAVELIDRNPALVAGFFLSGIAGPAPPPSDSRASLAARFAFGDA